jgi:hypothetical protein
MAANEHLNKALFHGTSAFLKEGDVVEPRTQWGNDSKEAYATAHYPSAAFYAGSRASDKQRLFGMVYEVEPLDAAEVQKGEVGRESYVSKKGFRVKKVSGYQSSTDYGM